MSIIQREIRDLFRQFGSPLAGYASTSSARKALAEMLARQLWTAMIAGPQMEQETWKVLKTEARLSDEDLRAIQGVYCRKMKAVVSEEQLAALRERYKVEPREPGE